MNGDRIVKEPNGEGRRMGADPEIDSRSGNEANRLRGCGAGRHRPPCAGALAKFDNPARRHSALYSGKPSGSDRPAGLRSRIARYGDTGSDDRGKNEFISPS